MEKCSVLTRTKLTYINGISYPDITTTTKLSENSVKIKFFTLI